MFEPRVLFSRLALKALCWCCINMQMRWTNCAWWTLCNIVSCRLWPENSAELTRQGPQSWGEVKRCPREKKGNQDAKRCADLANTRFTLGHLCPRFITTTTHFCGVWTTLYNHETCPSVPHFAPRATIYSCFMLQPFLMSIKYLLGGKCFRIISGGGS